MSSRQIAAVLGIVAFLIVAVVAVMSPLYLGVWRVSAPESKPAAVMKLEGQVTEADFQNAVQDELKTDPVRANIWRGARSDHRLVVHAILACKQKLAQLTSMPLEMFSALLLDLTPSGGHVLPDGAKPTSAATPGPTPSVTSSGGATRPATAAEGTASGNPPVSQFTLKPAERQLLSLSDSISRARLLSVSEVSEALPNAMRLWWIVLLVSGLATLFVTLQTKLRRPPDQIPLSVPKPIPPSVPNPKAPSVPTTRAMSSDTVHNIESPASEEPTETKKTETTDESQQQAASKPTEPEKTHAEQLEAWRLAQQERWTWRRQKWAFETVAFMAVALSITGTSLTALKQYYDPTRALVQNEHALRELRKLHQEITLAIECTSSSDGDQQAGEISYGEADAMKNWTKRIVELQAEIVPPYAAAGGSITPGATSPR